MKKDACASYFAKSGNARSQSAKFRSSKANNNTPTPQADYEGPHGHAARRKDRKESKSPFPAVYRRFGLRRGSGNADDLEQRERGAILRRRLDTSLL